MQFNIFKPLILSIILLFNANYIISQNEQFAEIDSIVNYYHEKGMFNGTILLAKNKEIIYHKSIGKADIENNKMLNKNTTFCLASITKQFTARGIMILVNENKLKYSDTLGDIFPELPKYLHQITIKNLLQHTSGLKRTHYQQHEKLNNLEVFNNLKQSSSDTLLFEPGTDLKYSNTAYILLAIIIEKISGQSYEQFLEENIFGPLGMTNSFVFTEDDKGRENIAIAFDGFGNKDDYNVLTYGTAGIYSSPEDIFRWTQSFTTDQILPYQIKKEAYEASISNSGKVLTRKIREHSWSYGYGLLIYRDNLEGVVGHSGAFGGFYNIAAKDLKNDHDVIILTNNGRLIDINGLGKVFLNILRNQPYDMPELSIAKAIHDKCHENIDEGISYYKQLKNDFPKKYSFENPSELNRLGYAFLYEDKIEEAIKIFQLLVSEFPETANPYDSLAEAYFLKEDYKLATDNYTKAISLGGTGGNAKSMLDKIKNLKK